MKASAALTTDVSFGPLPGGLFYMIADSHRGRKYVPLQQGNFHDFNCSDVCIALLSERQHESPIQSISFLSQKRLPGDPGAEARSPGLEQRLLTRIKALPGRRARHANKMTSAFN